jgi:benzoyl-CoA reductase/2-hydroxyglutaryl-CoA dehydratase subunit BcrC/BadD/HgdB
LPNLKEQARELLSSMAKENSIDGVIHISYNAAGPAHGIKAYGYAVRQASR